MKIKFLSLLLIAMSMLSITAKAAVVDTSSCAWKQISSTYLQSVTYALQCNGFIPAYKNINITAGGTCTLTAASGYSVTGTCNSFVVSSDTPAVSACTASGKAGKTIATSDGAHMSTAVPAATATCAPCGLVITGGPAYGSSNFTLSCANQ